MSADRTDLIDDAPTAQAPHASGPTGARDVDAEGPSRLQASRPRRGGERSDENEANASDADLYHAVVSYTLTYIPRQAASTFVPSSIMMMFVVSQMDELMCINRYWTTKMSLWCPLMSRIYYGTLFFIQIFRCMIMAGIATPEIKLIVRNFEEQYEYLNLPIAGPLVPFFRALCICETTYEEYGVVSPCVLKDCGATDATSHALPELTRLLLPNLTGLRRGYNRMLNVVGGNAQLWDHNLGSADPAAATVAIAHNAANEQARDARIMPGTLHSVAWAQRARNNFANYPRHIDIPNIEADAGDIDYSQFLGFDDGIEWFGEVAGMMRDHAKYFSNTTTMASIPVKNGPASLVITTGKHVYPDRNAHRAAAIHETHYNASSVSVATIPSPVDKLAALTQINYVPPANYGPQNDNCGSIGHTRFGEFWSRGPNRYTANEYNPTLAIPEILVNKYHLDRPAGPR